jgi:hypothetical protein
VHITGFGGPEVTTSSTCPAVPGNGQQLFDVSTAGVNFTDAHHRVFAREISAISENSCR